MYFQLPMINKPDEFFVEDLTKVNKQPSALSPDQLKKNTAQMTTDLSSTLFNAIDAKWFQTAKESVKLKDGTAAKAYRLEVTKKNEKELSSALNAKLPEMIDILNKNGMISADQAAKMKAGPNKPVQLLAPGFIQLAADDQASFASWTCSLTMLRKAPDKPIR